MKIGILNYGLGNVGSVYSAFKFYKYDVSLVEEPQDLDSIDFIVLAGVGNFQTAIARLRQRDFIGRLDEEVTVKKRPVLGICLGMQLFADFSLENGRNAGLGWIKGEVAKMQNNSVRIPHIGWNKVMPLDQDIFQGMHYNTFYFMHSYSFRPQDKEVIIARTQYGDLDIVSAVKKDNIVGVQFHPEKSQGDGLRLLRNIVEILI